MPSVFLAGLIQSELRSFDQSHGHLSRVLERAPGNLIVRRAMIVTFVRSGHLSQAIVVLQAGLRKAPADRQFAALAGEVYLQNGEFVKAATYFDIAAKRDPTDAVARTRLGIVRMASGDSGRAFADLESAVQLDSSKYQADLVLVVSHLRRR